MMDGSVRALDEQSGSEWPHEFKVSAAAMPPLLRSVLVDNIKPDTVSVQSLLEVLGRASPHHLNMAFEAPVLHVPAALSAKACATLRAAVDSERTIARDSVDGGPEHQLNLSREALELLIGRDQCSRIWQLPKRFRMSTAVVPVAVPAATDTGDAASEAWAEEAEAKGTAAVEAELEAIAELKECFVRRYSAGTRPWIPFHTDAYEVTVNVALGSDDAFGGGALLGVYGGEVRAICREEGDATVHSSKLLHGVTAMARGVRYSLIVFFDRKGQASGRWAAKRDVAPSPNNGDSTLPPSGYSL